jgi:signal transduction histidine kinase
VSSRFAWRTGGREIEFDPRPELRVSGDRIRLEQALGNLVDNALRYGDGDVHLSAQLDDGAVELHVADRGGGFPPEFVERAFDRFTRADTARFGGGAGLGLSIVRAIALAHGGEAHAANRGGGADVWLVLPRS